MREKKGGMRGEEKKGGMGGGRRREGGGIHNIWLMDNGRGWRVGRD